LRTLRKYTVVVVVFVIASSCSSVLWDTGKSEATASQFDPLLEAVYDVPGDSYPSSPVVGDIDNDGHPEIVFGSCGNPKEMYNSKTARGNLTAIRKNGGDLEVVWNVDLGGCPFAPALGDINNDLLPEVVTFIWGGTGWVYALAHNVSNPSVPNVVWKTELEAGFGYHFWTDHGPSIGDVNGDGLSDVAVYVTTEEEHGLGRVVVLDGESGSILPGWPQTDDVELHYEQIYIADIVGEDGSLALDGSAEVIVAAAARLLDSHLFVYDGKGVLLWRGAANGNFAIVDLEGDGLPEIVTSSYRENGVQIEKILVYNGDGSVKYEYSNKNFASGPTAADFDGDGLPEVAMASRISPGDAHSPGDIRLYDFVDYSKGLIPKPYRWESTVIEDDEWDSPDLAAADLSGDGIPDVIATTDDTALHVLDGKDGSLLWKSGISIDENEHSPIIADVDQDGHAEIVVPSGSGFIDEDYANYDRDILVFGNDPVWGFARPVWNQVAFQESGIKDDLSVPAGNHPWIPANTWRAQTSPAFLSATVDCDSDTLNLDSKGTWITCYLELPFPFDPSDVNATTVLLNDQVPPELDPKYGFVKSEESYIVDHDGDGILERLLKFSRGQVEDILPVGDSIRLWITGSTFDGSFFEGIDVIRVMCPPDYK
jgi:hypothetical protein